ncbi:MAG: hypothetical protein CM1200mP38_2740 [Dehalococcoidia bacterium]|nr:MAG: hypothetical protein CM1200mP38_2740 [Dehalococcoidia bacterium]
MSIKTKIINQWDVYIAFPFILILAILIRSTGLNWDDGFFWTPIRMNGQFYLNFRIYPFHLLIN